MRKTKITLERERLFVLRPAGSSRRWCEECGETVYMVAADEAALLADSSMEAVTRQVEAGTLHSLELTDGHLLVCLRSLVGG
jgi:hypothetical protein